MTPLLTDPSDFCPGCNARFCECPPSWLDDALYDDAYDAGFAAAQEAGLGSRPVPTPSFWADTHAQAWHQGFDAGSRLPSSIAERAAPETPGDLHGPWRVSDTPF